MSSIASRASNQVSTQKDTQENRNIMEGKYRDLYTDAHLFVSAIRICEHQNNTPPNIEDICQILSMSIEHSSYICRKLKQMGIIDVIKGSYGDRLFVRDFLKIEEIQRGDNESKLEEELKKFRESQKGLSQKIESIQTQQAEKKKNLFAEMEKKLKQELDKK
jgi:DNA-binding IscR family transcriptional regulator